MTTRDDPRDVAIKRHHDRVAKEKQIAAERQRENDAKAQLRQQSAAVWPTAYNAICLGVMSSNEYFGRGGAPFVTAQRPNTKPYSASFEIRPSGNLNREASFSFTMDDNGLVQITTDASRVGDLPHAVPVTDVTAAWAQKVADQVMIAVLGGQRMTIED